MRGKEEKPPQSPFTKGEVRMWPLRKGEARRVWFPPLKKGGQGGFPLLKAEAGGKRICTQIGGMMNSS